MGLLLLSHHPWLFWATVLGPLTLRSWQDSPLGATALVVGFYVAIVGTKVALAVAVAGGRRWLTDTAYRRLLLAAGILLALVGVAPWTSILTEVVDPLAAPEVWVVREQLRSWRFYDGFRVDAEAPARRPQVGTRTWAVAEDGRDLAAALQTIREDSPGLLDEAVADAFDGARLRVTVADGLFDVELHQPGMLRPLRSTELSDGTLRYLLWLAALMTPVPPRLMALNEPETSLHPSLVPPLARAIDRAASRAQVVVVTHSAALVEALSAAVLGDGHDLEALRDVETEPGEVAPLRLVELTKDLGETFVVGQGMLSTPSWEWGRR